VNALTKMKSVAVLPSRHDRLRPCFIRLIPTPTGRKIRFVTNRLLRFGESYYNTQSAEFNLTAGEFDLNDSITRRAAVRCSLRTAVINKRGAARISAKSKRLDAQQPLSIEQSRTPSRKAQFRALVQICDHPSVLQCVSTGESRLCSIDNAVSVQAFDLAEIRAALFV